MKLTIDNLAGLGPVDYSGEVGAGGIKIVRRLNEPATMECLLCLEGTALAVPVRRARVVVASDAGTLLFTGYLTTEPVAVYAGVASEGAVYRLAVRAVSDEWLLDKQAGLTGGGTVLDAPGGTALGALLNRLGGAGIAPGALSNLRSVGVYEAADAAPWSASAGALARAAYGSYRVLNGAVSLTPVGGVTHTLTDGDGSLNVAALKVSAVKELANDVTVTGALEPAACWTELFAGDGTTAIFQLTGQPAGVNAGRAVLVSDDFSAAPINRQRWVVTDPGAHIGLSGDGLALTGGNGLDGQTTLVAYDAMEMGGTLVVELADVALTTGSAGLLGGMYAGATLATDCFAGFNVRQSAGNTVLVPLVNGAETGTVFPMVDGHRYTLRLRLHCVEMLRVKQAFYAATDATGTFAVTEFGGGLVDAPVSLVFEVTDLGVSSNTPATVLYDGMVTSSPAHCSFGAVNALQLFGAVGSVSVTRTGSGWVRSTDPASGVVSTRLVGAAGMGLDCTLDDKATFFPGRVPVAGETVAVSYRGRRRAVARMADVASVAAEAAAGVPGTSRWLGHVVRPAARSTEDCENAAQAVLSFAASRAAAVTGTYVEINPAGGDVWPGDLLAFDTATALTANGSSVNGIVRQVTIEDGSAAPEALRYSLAFANDWAEGLGMTLSEAVAADALLPAVAIDSTVAEAARVLANLQQLAVLGASGSGASFGLSVDAGVAPPAGGGFEVRRRDSGFGLGSVGFTASDLVLRSPVRGFSIPVAAVGERFFVRMYDGSSPPLYSRESSAIVTHLPIG